MAGRKYAGGVGCDCCDEGDPCSNTCGACAALVASDYCLCLKRITLTNPGTTGCTAFELVLDPPICIAGVCSDVDPTIVVFPSAGPFVYEAPDGSHITIEFGGRIQCIPDSPFTRYDYLVEFDASTLSDKCDFPVLHEGSGLTGTYGGPDPCDLDAYLGTYVQNWFNIGLGAEWETEITFSKGGTCP